MQWGGQEGSYSECVQTNGHLQTPQTLHYDELTLFGAFGLQRRDYADALHMIADRRIEVASMVTHRFGLAQIEDAFAMAESGAAMKVAIIDV